MPGVLLIEAMAQTSGWLVVATYRFDRMPFLAAVKDAKFRMFVTPGQQLSVKADLVHQGSGYAVTEASVVLDTKLICAATSTFGVADVRTDDMNRRWCEAAALVGSRGEVPADA